MANRLTANEGLRVDKTAYFDAEVDNGNSGAGDTIDWTVGNKQKSTISANTTLTFTDPAGPCNLLLKLVNGGAFTLTWAGESSASASKSPSASASISGSASTSPSSSASKSASSSSSRSASSSQSKSSSPSRSPSTSSSASASPSGSTSPSGSSSQSPSSSTSRSISASASRSASSSASPSASLGNVYWPAGVEPTWTASGIDIVSFYFDGTNYYGAASLNFL